MIVITEEQFHNRTVYYRKEVDNSGHVIRCDRYDCETKLLKGAMRKFIMITDRHGVIRPMASKYVNNTRRGKSLNTRMQMATAIQFYYTFCEMFGYDPMNIKAFAAEKFTNFLLGLDVKPENGSKVTFRSTRTVKGYKGMIHKFLKSFHYSTDGFEPENPEQTIGNRRNGKREAVSQRGGDPDLRSGSLDKLLAPKHFTPIQAKALAKAMNEAGDRTMLCIFRLGYGYGLRRGEILGLTINDIKSYANKETGELLFKVVLRNRLSDRMDQNAKTLRHPSEPGQYDSSDFRKSVYDIDIDESMYNLILEVYNNTHNPDRVGFKAYQMIREISRADDTLGKDNYYIFVNKGTKGWDRLSGQTLNNHLRKYFDAFGLDLGNVSHAMRHSFAMFHAYYAKEKVDMEKLRRLMRHASIESTRIYFNIPREALKAIREKYSVELKELIPEFR